MTTYTWNQINTALTAEGLSPARILKILLAMPKHDGVRTSKTPYTRAEITAGILKGYPFSAAHCLKLASRVNARLHAERG